MLRELAIRNFAIVESLNLVFGPGLTCFTGETGAGKSILVDALSFILGGRPGPGVVSEKAETSVEALFDVSCVPEASSALEELGLDAGGELVIRRVAGPPGRGRAYVNGSIANAATLQRLGEWLVDIHGQHEHQSLLKVERHIGLMDEFCAAGDERSRYRELYSRVSDLSRRIADLKARERERAGRIDMLGFQAAEIEAAALITGEDDILAGEREKLLHADRLRELAQGALDGLRERDESALALLEGATKALEEITSVLPGQAETLSLVESAVISAGEASAMLRDLSDKLESDPERLAEVEDRLELIKSLKKKYGDTVGEVIEYGARAREELGRLDAAEAEAEGLEGELSSARRDMMESGARLSGLRRECAGAFSARVCSELSGMGMPKAVFKAELYPLESPGQNGLERAEFLFSANPGKGPLPLAKIASGGELSRVMLALKVVLARRDTVPTLVFDEVDSGIGGVTAGAVGRKLREAAAGRQVLCVTHLPQIASLAEEHFSVVKKTDDSGTEVSVSRLAKDERVAELARMLGGEGSSTAEAHAEELVRQGERIGQA